MAWSVLGALGATADKTAGTSIAHVTGSVNCAAGSVVIVGVSKDNDATTSGETNEITSVTDSVGGNTWVKVLEQCSTRGSADDGSVVALFYSKLTNAINIGQTITANFSSSKTAKCIFAASLGIGAGNVVTVAGTAAEAQSPGEAGSLVISGLASREYFFMRMMGLETSSAAAITPTSTYSAPTGNQTSGSPGNGNQAIRSEYLIATGTGSTSQPTIGSTALDNASIFAALKEAAAPVSVAISGNASTAAIGSFAVALSLALSGVGGTGSVGTVVPPAAYSVSLAGNVGTSGLGSLTPSMSIAATGNVATGSVGNLSPSLSVGVSGNAATGSIGSLTESISLSLSGNAGTGAVGTLIPSSTTVTVVVDTHDGGPEEDKFRRKRERLREELEITFNKTLGLDLPETIEEITAAVAEVAPSRLTRRQINRLVVELSGVDKELIAIQKRQFDDIELFKAREEQELNDIAIILAQVID